MAIIQFRNFVIGSQLSQAFPLIRLSTNEAMNVPHEMTVVMPHTSNLVDVINQSGLARISPTDQEFEILDWEHDKLNNRINMNLAHISIRLNRSQIDFGRDPESIMITPLINRTSLITNANPSNHFALDHDFLPLTLSTLNVPATFGLHSAMRHVMNILEVLGGWNVDVALSDNFVDFRNVNNNVITTFRRITNDVIAITDPVVDKIVVDDISAIRTHVRFVDQDNTMTSGLMPAENFQALISRLGTRTAVMESPLRVSNAPLLGFLADQWARRLGSPARTYNITIIDTASSIQSSRYQVGRVYHHEGSTYVAERIQRTYLGNERWQLNLRSALYDMGLNPQRRRSMQ